MRALRPPLLALSLSLGSAFACYGDPPAVDLEGPRVTHASLSGPRSVEVPVGEALVVELSEALDPASLRGSVALLAWERLEQGCARSPVCELGSCERGRCQRSPLSSSVLAALERGEFEHDLPASIELELELQAGEAGPDTRLLLRPRRLLAGHRRHTLVLGAGLRDRSGAPLVGPDGLPASWSRDFVTAAGGSSGPEPRLHSPAPGQGQVATNLARLETSHWPPLPAQEPGVTLTLEAMDGGAPARLRHLGPCPSGLGAPGTCLSWELEGELRGDTRYRPAGGTLLDRLGRAASRPGPTRETWFATAGGPDLEPPAPEVVLELRGRCLIAWIELQQDEPVEGVLELAGVEHGFALPGSGSIGVELEPVDGSEPLAWSLLLRDLAGNEARAGGELAWAPSLSPQLPRLRISEVLANPAGPEPDAEFIELLAGPEGASLEGLVLSERSPRQLRAAWAAGEELPGQGLAAIELAAGELVVIVGEGWRGDAALDPLPPAGARVVRVEGSLGEGGLKNAGEHLSLWVASPAGPVIVASYGNWIDTSASRFNGRSVVSGPDACDLPGRWRPHPQGRSSPGSLP